jgi:asparagine synthase (glutamine-hydrolysing)
MGSFYFWNIDRRDIALAPYALLATIPRVFCPYLDHALYDFLSALPARLLLDREFHAETIRRGYPHHAHIPFQDKSAPPRSTWQQDARFAREMAAYVLRRKPSRWIRNRYLLPRMLGSLLSSRYAASTRWFGPLAAYLLHFESVMNGAGWPTADPGSEPRVCN